MTSEQVHWILGAVVTGAALLLLLLLLRAAGLVRAAWLDYVLPVALLLLALETFIDPILHGGETPAHGKAETAQHRTMGLVAAAAGGIELLRMRGRVKARVWALALPFGVLAVGVFFLVHGEHGPGPPDMLVLVQHRIMGTTLLVAALARSVATLRSAAAPGFEIAWLVAVLLFGLELLLYREGGVVSFHGG